MAYEDLLSVLAGRKAEASATNPFLSFGQNILQASPMVQGASYGKNLGAIALQGLLSGVTSGIGRNQVNSQMAKEADALRGFFAQPAEAQNGPLAENEMLAPYAQYLTASGKAEQDALKARGDKIGDAIAIEQAKAILANPGKAMKSGASGIELKPTNSGGFKIDWSGAAPMAATTESAGPKSLAEKEMALFDQYKAQGYPDTQAATAATKQMESLRKKMNTTFSAIDSARQNATTLEDIINTAQAGIQGAGRTGPGSSNVLASILGVASQDQADKAAATTLLDSVKPSMLRLNKVPGMGAMSDFESKAFFGASPGSDKTPEQNMALLGRLKEAASIQRQYADFLESYVENNGTDVGAQREWEKFKNANLKGVLGGGENGGGSQGASGSWGNGVASQNQPFKGADGKTYRFID